MNEQLQEIQRELRLVKSYALFLTVLMGLLWVSGFTRVPEKQRFGEIDTERINIIEKDGKYRFVLTNTTSDPGAIRNGTSRPRASGNSAAIIFYNDHGDESGALLSVGRRKEDGGYSATSRLVFDQFDDDETIALQYIDCNGQRDAGLLVLDRPDTPTTDEVAAEIRAIWKMPDGPGKWETLEKLRARGVFEKRRLFVGKTRWKTVQMDLADRQGNTRLRLWVDSLGTPRLDFRDERGNLTYRLPDSVLARRKK